MFRPSEQLRLHAPAIAGTQRVPVAPGNDNRSHLDASSGRVASRLSIALAQQNNPALSSALARAIARARRGFTFTEVMFAVIILGVGFVMIAAILPVAIQQSKSNVDDATGAAVAREGIQTVMTSPPSATGTAINLPSPSVLFPPTAPPTPASPISMRGQVFYFGDVRNSGAPYTPAEGSPATGTAVGSTNAATPYLAPYEQINLLCGNMIYNNDPRFGWIAFYQRDVIYNPVTMTTSNASSATLTILVMQARLRPTYTSTTDLPVVVASSSPPVRANLSHPFVGTFAPKLVRVYLTEGVTQPDLVTFESSSTGGGVGNSYHEPRAGEGAFIIIANDPTLGGMRPTIPFYGGLNGKVYRLGQLRTDLNTRGDTYELQAGYDMTCDTTNLTTGYNENIPYQAHSTTTIQTSGTPATAYIVGRGLPDGTIKDDGPPLLTTNNVPTGAVQDVAVYQVGVPISQ